YGGAGWVYLRGWHRLHRAGAPLGSPIRPLLLLGSTALVLVAFFPPFYEGSHQVLYLRAIQKILVAMLAAPLFWLATPVHISLRGLPYRWRRFFIHAIRADTRSGSMIRIGSAMGTTWLLYVAAIVIWHDSKVVNWTMAGTNRHFLTLTFMFAAALLYWVHIVGTGLRLRYALPVWVIFAYAVGVEIPNMTAGITIAYSSIPLYAHYTAIAKITGADIFDAQVLAGGLVWFMGSIVFFFSAVMVVNRIFVRHGSTTPQYHPEWDSEERMIAPGLEHRLNEKR
ncbi:MAG: cytochrome c oxidase assembly protein, partial [Caldilineaceae bacterium]|nr:cytochrome c oxidase assembly protein [Caldilineaceae bacterium]